MNLVLEAFQILDADKSGVVELNDIMAKYNGKKHPDVISGKRTESEILAEFMDTFDGYVFPIHLLIITSKCRVELNLSTLFYTIFSYAFCATVCIHHIEITMER
jgi:hypothetical protein